MSSDASRRLELAHERDDQLAEPGRTHSFLDDKVRAPVRRDEAWLCQACREWWNDPAWEGRMANARTLAAAPSSCSTTANSWSVANGGAATRAAG